MKRISALVLTILISGVPAHSLAARCSCDDWMEKGGYCVDYINSRIPVFPSAPNKEEMADLKNTDIADVTEGDVAIFTIKNYWHVAYVEKVQRNQQGEATAIDVSEMNFGDELSFAEFKSKWKSESQAEWNRALCCGITDHYDQVSLRKSVALSTVKQIWSPDDVVSEGVGRQRVKAIFGKVREAINRFVEFTGREL